MLLAIDSGNTNVVFALLRGEEVVGRWRAASDARRTADEYAVWLTQLMALEGLGVDDVDGVILSNVVPAAGYNLQSLCTRYFGSEAVTVKGAAESFPIEIRLDRPDRIGDDRIANAVGAHARYPGPLIIVDFGTATTFDVIAADGAYEGGAIAPGINLSLDALYRGAAHLPRILIEKPQQVIGADTVPAMQSGVFWGYIGLIEGLAKRIAADYGEPMTVIATGGLAPLFSNTTDAIHHVDHELTLQGMRLLYEHANPA
ncbi:MAG: type III pantothenate kinase [Rhodospirillales bacterium]